MNPPYSRNNVANFCKKAYEESQLGCTIVGLLKCDSSTTYYHKYVMKAHEIRAVTPRVTFISPVTGKSIGSPPFASKIVIWKPGEPEYLKYVAWSWK